MPLIIPLIDKILLACIPSINVRIIGTPPTQLASKNKPAFIFLASSSSSGQCFAKSSLFEVTTVFPLIKAVLTKVFATPVPPITSTTISTSGLEQTSSMLEAIFSSAIPNDNALSLFFSSTHSTVRSTP